MENKTNKSEYIEISLSGMLITLKKHLKAFIITLLAVVILLTLVTSFLAVRKYNYEKSLSFEKLYVYNIHLQAPYYELGVNKERLQPESFVKNNLNWKFSNLDNDKYKVITNFTNSNTKLNKIFDLDLFDVFDVVIKNYGLDVDKNGKFILPSDRSLLLDTISSKKGGGSTIPYFSIDIISQNGNDASFTKFAQRLIDVLYDEGDIKSRVNYTKNHNDIDIKKNKQKIALYADEIKNILTDQKSNLADSKGNLIISNGDYQKQIIDLKIKKLELEQETSQIEKLSFYKDYKISDVYKKEFKNHYSDKIIKSDMIQFLAKLIALTLFLSLFLACVVVFARETAEKQKS